MLSWRATRRTPCLVAATAVALGMLMPLSAHADGTQVTGGDPGTVAPPPAPVTAKVKVKTTAVPAVTPESSSSDVVAELPETSTAKFRMVGVTWSRDGQASGVTVKVRTRTAGEWSSWTTLGVDDDDEGGDPGTDPLWVGAADGVAARVTSTSGTPEGVHITTIDPGDAAGAATDETATASRAAFSGALDAVAVGQATTVATTDGAPGYTPKPTIISRASWGASAGTPCDSPASGDHTMGVVVHHTAGSNSYTKSESRAIVRGIQAYHVKARKWCDIGYNFLVDKYGQIFQGRNGAVDQPVRAAHAGDVSVNTYTMGVSMMGTYTSSEPTTATQDAMVKLIGWRIGTTFHAATGTYSVGKYRLNRIAGHRDVVGTECPGQAAYAWLSRPGGLRDRVSAYVADYASPIKTRVRSLGAAKTGPVFVGEYPFAAGGGGRKVRLAKVDIYSSRSGTFAVGDHFRTRYNALRSQSGTLGLPASSTRTTKSPAVRYQRFTHGTIYRVTRRGRTDAYALWGRMDDKYRSLRGTRGRLGAPKSSEVRISGGRLRATFAHGTLTLQRNGTVKVAIR